MSRYDDCLRRAKAEATELRTLAEQGRVNASVIMGLMESYLDQPAFAVADRPALLRDALGKDWEEWRARDYGVGRPRPRYAPETSGIGVNSSGISGAR